MTSSSDRTGVLVIRIWVERAAPHQVRARITTATDLMHGPDGVSAAGSLEQVEAVVGHWLREFSAAASFGAASSEGGSSKGGSSEGGAVMPASRREDAPVTLR